MVQQLKIFNTHCLQTNLSDGYLCTVDPIVSLNLSPNKQETGLGDSEDKKEKINRKWHIWKYLYSYNGATVGFFCSQTTAFICLAKYMTYCSI